MNYSGHPGSEYYYRYSSTRDRLLWIDEINIEGKFYEDNEAPVITGCKFREKFRLRIVYHEPPAENLWFPGIFH